MINAISVIIPTFFLLLFGGLGPQKEFIEISGLILGLISIFYLYLKNKKILLPYGFFYFVIFFLLALLSQIWSRNPENGVEYLLLFASGGALLVVFLQPKDGQKVFGNIRLVANYFGNCLCPYLPSLAFIKRKTHLGFQSFCPLHRQSSPPGRLLGITPSFPSDKNYEGKKAGVSFTYLSWDFNTGVFSFPLFICFSCVRGFYCFS